MASAPYVRLLVHGHIGNSQGWSLGMSFGYLTPVTSSDLFTWLGLVGADIDTWMQDATGGPVPILFGSNTTYDGLNCYQYPANATKADAQAAVVVTKRTGTGAPIPSQLAVAYSLYTGNPGRDQRGRFYVPITRTPQTGFDTQGQLTAATCGNLATAAATMIQAVASRPLAGQTLTPVVASVGSKAYRVLGSVAVDSLVDTQRRRTDKVAITTAPQVRAI